MIDWGLLTDKQKAQVKPAIDYIEGRSGKNAASVETIEDSIVQLSEYVQQIDKTPNLTPEEKEALRSMRNELYHEINGALIERRDHIIKDRQLKWEGELGDRVEALLATDEGSLLINAMIILNRTFVEHMAREAMKEMHIPSQNAPFDMEDVYAAATYGLERQKERSENKAEGHNLNNQYHLGAGLLGAIAGYRPDAGSHFVSYAGVAVANGAKKYINQELATRHKAISWPSESEGLTRQGRNGRQVDFEREDIDPADPISAIDHLGRNDDEMNQWLVEQNTNPFDRVDCRDSSDGSLSEDAQEPIMSTMKTLSYRQREVLKLRYGLIDGQDYTLEEVGNIFKVEKERIRQVEAKALRRLREPWRSDMFMLTEAHDSMKDAEREKGLLAKVDSVAPVTEISPRTR